MVIKIRKSGVKSGAFPNPSTQFTKENAAYYGAKGGKRGRIAKSLAKRKKCSPKCPFYDRCVFVAYGIKTGKCPLSEYGKKFQATYFVGSLTNKATLTKLMKQFSILILGVIDAMSEKIEGNEEEINLKLELLDKMLEMYKVLSR